MVANWSLATAQPTYRSIHILRVAHPATTFRNATVACSSKPEANAQPKEEEQSLIHIRRQSPAIQRLVGLELLRARSFKALPILAVRRGVNLMNRKSLILLGFTLLALSAAWFLTPMGQAVLTALRPETPTTRGLGAPEALDILNTTLNALNALFGAAVYGERPARVRSSCHAH